MKLRYKNAARIDLESFINHYEEAFRELYSDTGLWNEKFIIAGYERGAEQLFDNIEGAIYARLHERTIVGRKQITEDWFEACISVGTRLIVVHYSEDRKGGIRWIEAITIDRKPIIF